MNCADIEILLCDYVDGTLRGEQKSAVEELNAQVRSDRAQVDNSKAELSYTRLVAPFDGITGLRLLDVGNIIHPPTGSAAT